MSNLPDREDYFVQAWIVYTSTICGWRLLDLSQAEAGGTRYGQFGSIGIQPP
jgi:hypothetical protein